MRTSGRLFLAAVVALLAAAAGCESRAADAPWLRFVTPRPNDIPIGDTTIEVAVTGAEPGDVVEVFVDGHPIGRIPHEPWTFVWKAGDKPNEHELAAILLRGGREAAVARARTRGLGFSASAKIRAVSLSPIVTDDRGRYVRGLDREDFRLFVDGKGQEVETFEEVNSALSVVLVVDVSTSMTLKIGTAREAALEFLAALKADDQAAVLTFASNVRGFTPLSTDKSGARAALVKARVSGETALYDATAVALRKLQESSGRRAVVLFTDGEDNRSRMSINRVIDLARASEASVFAVGQGVDTAEPLVRALGRMTEETGGRAWFIPTIENLSGAFKSVVTDLENQYFLTFTPRDQRPRTWHQVVVKVEKPGMTARARKSFLIE